MPNPEMSGYKCLFCNAVFAYEYKLAEHLSIHISGEKGFTCPTCSKVFPNYFNLKRHYLVHSGAKELICEICGKAFRRSDNLKEHMYTHSTTRQHKCAFCDKSFAVLTALRRHETVHTGAKNYKCDKCGRFFSQTSNRNKHEKICKSLSYVQTTIQPLPGGKVVTSTAHVMPISSTLVTTVASITGASGASATMIEHQHLGAAGATVTTFAQKSTAVTARQQSGTALNPQEDALLDDINQIINDDNAGSLAGSQSGLPNNTDPTTWISFDATGSGYDIDLDWTFDGIPDWPD